MKTPIYPEVRVDYHPEQEIVSDETKEIQGHINAYFEINTLLRMQHGGVWYLFKLKVSRVRNPKLVQAADPQEALQLLHREVYIHQRLHIIDPDAISADGYPVNYKHEDQRSEEDRLIAVYNLMVNKPQDKPEKQKDAEV